MNKSSLLDELEAMHKGGHLRCVSAYCACDSQPQPDEPPASTQVIRAHYEAAARNAALDRIRRRIVLPRSSH